MYVDMYLTCMNPTRLLCLTHRPGVSQQETDRHTRPSSGWNFGERPRCLVATKGAHHMTTQLLLAACTFDGSGLAGGVSVGWNTAGCISTLPGAMTAVPDGSGW